MQEIINYKNCNDQFSIVFATTVDNKDVVVYHLLKQLECINSGSE